MMRSTSKTWSRTVSKCLNSTVRFTPVANQGVLSTLSVRRFPATMDPGFIGDVLQRNEQFCSESVLTEDDVNSMFGDQKPQCSMLTCCDARVPSSAMGMNFSNEVFTVRNIGNQVKNSAGSLRFGMDVLKAPYTIVMGHTGCGAIKGAASDYRGLHSDIQKEVVPLTRVMQFCDSLNNASELTALSFEDKADRYSEVNVDLQIQDLLADESVKMRIQNKQIAVVGMVFDVTNAYGNGAGRATVVNVNGIRDPALILQSDVFAGVSKSITDTQVGRLFTYDDPSAVQFK